MKSHQLFAVIWEKSKLNLKSEAAVNYLSYCWWLFEPVIHMLCYYLVFELLLNRGGPDFVYFLLTGLVPWLWFAKIVNQGSMSLIGGQNLMGQIFIPKLFFPLVFVTQCSVKQLMVFSILLVFLLLSGFGASAHWLASVLVMVVQLLFMIPVVCMLAVLVAFVRDLNFVIPTLLQFMFFCSGIFFSIDTIAPQYHDLFFINPMAGLIHQYRETLLHNHWPDWLYLGKILLGSALLWLLTITLYRRHEYTITRLVQE